MAANVSTGIKRVCYDCLVVRLASRAVLVSDFYLLFIFIYLLLSLFIKACVYVYTTELFVIHLSLCFCNLIYLSVFVTKKCMWQIRAQYRFAEWLLNLSWVVIAVTLFSFIVNCLKAVFQVLCTFMFLIIISCGYTINAYWLTSIPLKISALFNCRSCYFV